MLKEQTGRSVRICDSLRPSTDRRVVQGWSPFFNRSFADLLAGMCNHPKGRWFYLIEDDGTVAFEEIDRVRQAWLKRLGE
jgi:hypothetical protein